MAYNTTLALAMVYAAGVQAPTANTKPTLIQATQIWANAYTEVQEAVADAGMDPDDPTSASSSSLFLKKMQAAEAYLTSAEVFLAKEGLGENAVKVSDRIRKRGEKILSNLRSSQAYWLANGAVAKATESGWASSHYEDDRDPDVDQTPGTGDVAYAPQPAFESTYCD